MQVLFSLRFIFAKIYYEFSSLVYIAFLPSIYFLIKIAKKTFKKRFAVENKIIISSEVSYCTFRPLVLVFTSTKMKITA